MLGHIALAALDENEIAISVISVLDLSFRILCC